MIRSRTLDLPFLVVAHVSRTGSEGKATPVMRPAPAYLQRKAALMQALSKRAAEPSR